MSLHPYADRQRERFLRGGAAIAALAVVGLVTAGRPSFAAALLAILLGAGFLWAVRREIERRSLAFVAVGAVAYLIAWNRGVPFLYAFSAACFGIVVVSHLLPRWVLRPVQGRINCPASITQGDTAELSITVENPGNVTLRLVEVDIPVTGAIGSTPVARALLVQLAPRQVEHLATQTPPMRRGCHAVGPLTVSTGFPLGLVTKSLDVADTARSLWVYPRMFPIEFLPISGEQFQQMGDAISPRTGGTDEFAGVREYRHGDSRRSIHWRASARYGDLVVKEFMRTTAATVTIALDLGRAGDVGEGIDTAAEDAIRIAASVARYVLQQRHYVQLALCGNTLRTVGPVEAIGELDVVLRALAVAVCDGDATFGSHLGRVVGIVPHNSTAVLVHTDANAGSLGAMASLRQRGVLVVPIVIDALSYGGVRVRGAASSQPRTAVRARRVLRGADLAALFRQ